MHTCLFLLLISLLVSVVDAEENVRIFNATHCCFGELRVSHFVRRLFFGRQGRVLKTDLFNFPQKVKILFKLVLKLFLFEVWLYPLETSKIAYGEFFSMCLVE